MEGNKEVIKRNGINGITQEIRSNITELSSNIVTLDLSNKDLSDVEYNLALPPNIVYLNLSHNKLNEVPGSVLILQKLKTLDLSFNNLVYFDEVPNSCHTLEQLNLACNKLLGPPTWVWTETPRNLIKLNMSGNENIRNSFVNGYFEELLKYTSAITEIDMSDCNLDRHLIIMSTFCKSKTVHLGSSSYSNLKSNKIENLPCEGLDNCCDIERLNLANTNLYTINPNIDIYEKLLEINLADNNINSLPNEFCNLVNLKVCILSCNKLLYLPDQMYKLNKLITLLLNDNELCMVPQCVNELPELQELDLYNNNISEVPEVIEHLEKLDLAQNYYEEPIFEKYLLRKQKLRLKHPDRLNGRRMEVTRPDSEHSTNSIDYEDLSPWESNNNGLQESPESGGSRSSTPEDWDSDAHWIPRYYPPQLAPPSPWLHFVKQKMAEGNFCPMDVHPISVVEKVQYEKMCNPQEPHESDGQFDDYSSDDS